MAHDHNHAHEAAGRNILVVFWLNFLFAVIEIVGGIFTNSMAIISDAIHDMGDCVSLGIAWYLEKVAGKGRDRKFSYGYKRFSLLGAVILSVILCVGAFIVIRESVGRLMDPQMPHAKGMLLLAIVGIAVNGAAVFRIKKGKTMNERAVYLHLMEDVLGWIAVLVVSVVMLFVEAPLLDPLLSLGITAWVLFNVFRNLRATFRVLLQGTPEGVDADDLCRRISLLDGVLSVHDLHLWTLDGQNNIATLHVVCRDGLPTQRLEEIKCEVRVICRKAGIGHATIELEGENELCELRGH